MLSSIEERLPISSQCPPSTAIACAAERQAALTAVRRGTLRRALPIKGLSSPSRHVHPRARALTRPCRAVSTVQRGACIMRSPAYPQTSRHSRYGRVGPGRAGIRHHDHE